MGLRPSAVQCKSSRSGCLWFTAGQTKWGAVLWDVMQTWPFALPVYPARGWRFGQGERICVLGCPANWCQPAVPPVPSLAVFGRPNTLQ